MMIGSKNLFAIEYEIADKSDFYNAKLRIWINGKFIGDYNNDSPIYTIYHYFNYLENNINEFTTDEFKSLTKEEIYRTMIPYNTKEQYFNLSREITDGLTNYDKFIVSLNEAFYHFAIRLYIEDSNVCFVWKLTHDNYDNIYPNYSFEIFSSKILIKEFKVVLKEFRENLTVVGCI